MTNRTNVRAIDEYPQVCARAYPKIVASVWHPRKNYPTVSDWPAWREEDKQLLRWFCGRREKTGKQALPRWKNFLYTIWKKKSTN